MATHLGLRRGTDFSSNGRQKASELGIELGVEVFPKFK